MIHVPTKIEWQLMVDYTFIRNRMHENTPPNFRRKQTKGFSYFLHEKKIGKVGEKMKYGRENCQKIGKILLFRRTLDIYFSVKMSCISDVVDHLALQDVVR